MHSNEASDGCLGMQNGVLIDQYARADITQLAKGNAYNRLQWEEMTVGQALALAQISSPSWPASQQGASSPVSNALALLHASIVRLRASHGKQERQFLLPAFK